MTISTHVLDLSAGQPAADVAVRLEHHDGRRWLPVGDGRTNEDGRVAAFARPGGAVPSGTYRLIFEIGAYFSARGVATFYPRAVVEFLVADGAARHHVPLLLSPYGYSTYRGS